MLGVHPDMDIKKWGRPGAPTGLYAINPQGTRKRFVGVTLLSAVKWRQKESQFELAQFPAPVSRREIKSWSNS